jgi:hypothetical protein
MAIPKNKKENGIKINIPLGDGVLTPYKLERFSILLT